MAGEPLPLDIVETLLDKLATDDTFRALFAHDPEKALQQCGSKNPKKYCDCLHVPKLASKEVIQQSRAALVATLTSTLNHNVPVLIAR